VPLFSGKTVRRESTQIVSEILQVAVYGAIISEIMSKVALNYAQLRQYVQILIKGKLLETSSQSRVIYRTTAKGKTFLKKYREITELLGRDAELTEPNPFEHNPSSKRTELKEYVLTPDLYRRATFTKYKCRVCDQPFKLGETAEVRYLGKRCIPYHKACFENLLKKV
jgi:predicted transcriptional regulator